MESILSTVIEHLHHAVHPTWFQIANRFFGQTPATTKWDPFQNREAADAFADTRVRYLVFFLKNVCDDFDPVLPKTMKLSVTAHPGREKSAEVTLQEVITTVVTPDFNAALVQLDRHAG